MKRGDLEKSIRNHIEEFCNSKFDKCDEYHQTELLIEITNLVDIHVRAEVNRILNDEYGVEKKKEKEEDWFDITTRRPTQMGLRTWTKANGSVIYYDASRVPIGMHVQDYLKMTGDYYPDGEERQVGVPDEPVNVDNQTETNDWDTVSNAKKEEWTYQKIIDRAREREIENQQAELRVRMVDPLTGDIDEKRLRQKMKEAEAKQQRGLASKYQQIRNYKPNF